MDVPDQPLNPPEPRCPDYNDYLEHECDRLNDEAKLQETCKPQIVAWYHEGLDTAMTERQMRADRMWENRSNVWQPLVVKK